MEDGSNADAKIQALAAELSALRVEQAQLRDGRAESGIKAEGGMCLTAKPATTTFPPLHAGEDKFLTWEEKVEDYLSLTGASICTNGTR